MKIRSFLKMGIQIFFFTKLSFLIVSMVNMPIFPIESLCREIFCALVKRIRINHSISLITGGYVYKNSFCKHFKSINSHYFCNSFNLIKYEVVLCCKYLTIVDIPPLQFEGIINLIRILYRARCPNAPNLS